MKCFEIRNNLSGYIDGVLDTKKTALIEDHLKGCDDCKAELASLRELVVELGELNFAEAPKDFLKELHKRIESESGFLRLMRTLFKPLKIKIPLELATAAAMAVLVVSIFNIQQKNEKIIDFPTSIEEKTSREETAEISAQPESKKMAKPEVAPVEAEKQKQEEIKVGSQKLANKKPERTLKDEAAPIPKEQLQAHEMSGKESMKKSIKAPISSLPEVYGDDGDLKQGVALEGRGRIADKLEWQKAPVEVRIVVGHTSGARILTTSRSPSKGKLEKTDARQSASKEPARPAPIEREMPEEIRARESKAEKQFSESDSSKSADEDITIAEIKNLIKLFDGKIIGTQYDEADSSPSKIDATIPAGNLKSFCGRLEGIAFMKFPCPEAGKNVDALESIPVRIILEKTE